MKKAYIYLFRLFFRTTGFNIYVKIRPWIQKTPIKYMGVDFLLETIFHNFWERLRPEIKVTAIQFAGYFFHLMISGRSESLT